MRFSPTPRRPIPFPPRVFPPGSEGFSPKENARFPFKLPPSRVSSAAMSEVFLSSL